MKKILLLTLAGTLLTATLAFAGGRIHGTVHTRDGDAVTGVIRWDRNEAYWDHFLDAQKNDRVRVSNEGGLDLRLFGIRISRAAHGRGWVRSQFSVPFGELRELEAGPGKMVTLSLRNGEQVEVRESGDLGSDMRGLVVTDDRGHETEVEWRDIDRVVFTADPMDDASDRLYGTAVTDMGDFTGFVVWDRDEALPEDILDGDDEDGRRHKIPFGEIRSIETDGKRAAFVTLGSGETLRLDGTNDVDSDNRGIEITISGMGKVELEWKHLQRLDFTPAPRSPEYADYDGGDVLRGTVTTADGTSHTGNIVWDRDESHTWEALDGEIEGVRFQILFGNIVRIDRRSPDGARVRLTDGLELDLTGSNDVGKDNKGIVVHRPDGTEVEITWDEFASAVFLED
jgi:hypothetical protein